LEIQIGEGDHGSGAIPYRYIQKRTCIPACVADLQVHILLFHVHGLLSVHVDGRKAPLKNQGFF